jgi:hypothetical protein
VVSLLIAHQEQCHKLWWKPIIIYPENKRLVITATAVIPTKDHALVVDTANDDDTVEASVGSDPDPAVGVVGILWIGADVGTRTSTAQPHDASTVEVKAAQ